MNPVVGWMEGKALLSRHFVAGLVALALTLGAAPPALTQQRTSPAPSRSTPQPAAIPAAEFSRMVQEFSEPGGYFRSDNFTSNETAYLYIVEKLKDLGVSGGAYLGVGPEQNFTYIAKVRPRIAFIVDIRRQAILQHLLYKAIFHRAENRAQFLAWLFSKPLLNTRLQASDSLEPLLDYIGEAPTTREAHLANLAAIRRTIERDFRFPLSPEDVQSLGYVYNAFWQAGLRISFRFGGAYGFGGFPNLRDLILATDQYGKRGNFLAREEDYQFVRELQRQNRVIPVVGDFAGPRALATVGGYLRTNGYTVSAFYTSNVEQFLYQGDVFNRFAENVGKLPVSGRSVILRAARLVQGRHPAWVPGHRMVPLLQRIPVFLDDHRAGRLASYWSLVNTHYISGTQSLEALPIPAFP